MRKKLFAVIMSAMMMITFMPAKKTRKLQTSEFMLTARCSLTAPSSRLRDAAMLPGDMIRSPTILNLIARPLFSAWIRQKNGLFLLTLRTPPL